VKFWKLENERITFAFRCEVIKKPSNEYTAIGFNIGDEFVASESDMCEDGSVHTCVGQGAFATFQKDEIKIKQVIRTTVATEIIDDHEKIDEYFKINKKHGL
jgi:hypothetical protein